MGAAAGGDDGLSDDQFNRVSFLSHFEGSNNGVNNAFDDGSASNHTITANGNVTQGSFSPFARPDGEWAFNNTASTNDSFKVTAHDNFDMTNSFTIEGWIFLSDLTANKLLFGRENNYWMTHDYQGIGGASGKFGFNYQNSGSWGAINASAATVANTWYFLQATYVGTTVTFYINGVSQGTASVSSPASNTDKPFYVLSMSNATHAGKASNVRLSSVARSTSLPTSKFTSDSDTELLVCQSNRFVDNGPDGHTITTTAGASVSAFGPFLTSAVYDPAVNGASAYFDGTADALSIAASPISASGNFTLEGWVYSNSASEQAIVGQYQGRSTGRMIITTGSGLLIFFQNGVTGGNNGSSVALGQWAHFVLQRTGSNIAFYVNGARVLNNSAGNIAQDYLVIGTEDVNSGSYPNTFDGYISNIRITSSAVYSEGTSITVPTAPYSTVTNTNFLLNMADGQAIDSAAQNNLNLFGTAKTSTAQYKFGTASLLLDGNSDYATFPENGANDIDGGGNWTVEFFWRFVNKTSPAYQELITKGTGFQIYTSSGSLSLALSSNNSSYDIANATGGTTLDNDVWYHLALVKNGTSYKLYLNGTSDLSVTSSSNLDTGGFPWFLGTLRTAETTYPSNGYMDEVRISKFARYTSNFTAPTEPFADKGQ